MGSFGVLNFEPSTGTDKSDPSFAMTFVSPDPSTILHTVPNVDVKAPTKKVLPLCSVIVADYPHPCITGVHWRDVAEFV